ncbi:MAG: hypothetical protein K6E20_01015 [Acholeplasmatales bacterium]|nr:hypothetical protein [Acholeplasmatales bacterium]
MAEMIFEPLKEYNEHYKNEFRKNSEEYFDSLNKKANIDVAINRETCKNIYKLDSYIETLDKKSKKVNKTGSSLYHLIVFGMLFAAILAIIPIGKYEFSGDAPETSIMNIMMIAFCPVFGLIYLLSFSTGKKGDPKKTKVVDIVFGTIIIVLSIVTIAWRLSHKSFGDDLKTVLIVVLVVIALLSIFSLLLKFILLNSMIKKINSEKTNIEAKRKIELDKAYNQMAPLNALYDWNIPATLIQKTIPMIQMDKILDANKAEYLYQKYGFKVGDENTSTVAMQSGSIYGNPFMICTDYKMRMANKTYTGSVTITWTTTIRVNGRTQTIPHVQVLTASVSAPAPSYSYDSYLVYGCEAAPNLNFSRSPNPICKKSDKEIKKYVEKMDKKLTKKGEKALMKGSSYQKLGNTEFEALFGGTDRDNEVEFRMLFTPLAQKNLLNLMKSEPYGDDFRINKRRCLNYVRSYHSIRYSQDPTVFIGFDYEKAKSNFISYNEKFFKSFYFELAPLLCIPLYQETKSKEYIYDDKLKCNFSMYEYEQVANSYNQNILKHPQSITGNIYKAERLESVGNTDKVKIHAYSFRGEKRVTYVNKLGGDGRIHTIPVYWIEYFPVANDTELLLSKTDISRQEYTVKSHSEKFASAIRNIAKGNAYKYERSIFSLVALSSLSTSDISTYNTNLDFNAFEVNSKLDLNKILDEELKETETSLQKEGDDALVEIQGDAKEIKEDQIESVEEVKEEVDLDLVDDDEE